MEILIIDTGIALPHALYLAEEGHDVYYYIAKHEAFPNVFRTIQGWGFPIKKVQHYEDVLSDVDFVIITDVGFGMLADRLRERGIKVFGGGAGVEKLEEDRVYMREVLQKHKIPVPRYKVAKYLDEVLEEVKKNPNWWIKINKFRGNVETFFAGSYETTRAKLQAASLFIFDGKIDYILEDPLSGVEIGCDVFVQNGKILKPYFFTIERRGEANLYFSVFSSPFDSVLEKIEPLLKGYYGMFCLEGFWDPEESPEPFITDITARFAYPGSFVVPKMLEHYGKFLYDILNNQADVVPVKHKIGMQVTVSSSENVIVEFLVPQKYRQYVTFQGCIKLKNKIFFVPETGFAPGHIVVAGDKFGEVFQILTEVEEEINIPGEEAVSISGLLKQFEQVLKIGYNPMG